MIIRTQDRLNLIQCKNVIMENWQHTRSRVRISEISRKDRDFTLGLYSDRAQAMEVMNAIQIMLEKESKFILNSSGQIEQVNAERVFEMPQDRALIKQ